LLHHLEAEEVGRQSRPEHQVLAPSAVVLLPAVELLLVREGVLRIPGARDRAHAVAEVARAGTRVDRRTDADLRAGECARDPRPALGEADAVQLVGEVRLRGVEAA